MTDIPAVCSGAVPILKKLLRTSSLALRMRGPARRLAETPRSGFLVHQGSAASAPVDQRRRADHLHSKIDMPSPTESISGSSNWNLHCSGDGHGLGNSHSIQAQVSIRHG